MNHIRNFCIIAHIDHGKSTLADRFLELTGTVSKREMRDQLLDTMDIERERGITIKLQPVRMKYSYNYNNKQVKNGEYQLNLIDTPGHVDFSYEVSRSLAAVEGAILLVDASQGIEAQTLANLYMALEHNLTIIPVVNKIDLPHAEPEKVASEICELLGCPREDIILASGKTGHGIEDILREVVEKVPSPKGDPNGQLRALIFDSMYDPYRGVIAYVRVVDGSVLTDDKLAMLQVKSHTGAEEVGLFNPKHVPTPSLKCGEIGYVITGFKDVASARVGDTITAFGAHAVIPLPGYREITPLVYAGLYTVDGDQYPTLREALGKLKLNDASLQFEPETSAAFGFGFRCGFLGLLHMEIIKERLEREAHIDLVATTPSVPYQVELMRPLTKNEMEQQLIMGILVDEQNPFLSIHSPAQLPEPSSVKNIKEPWAIVEIVVPKSYIGAVMEMAQLHRGLYQNLTFLDEDRSILKYELPISELIIDFYDQLKSITSGYGSLNYEFLEYRGGDLVKLSILVAGDEVDSLSAIVHRTHALVRGRSLLTKLKSMIPRQLFEIMLQAAVGGKIIAREDIPAVGKNVTAKLYGGDVTRKNKLLDKQKEGKKRLKRIGKVDIPTEVFLNLLKN